MKSLIVIPARYQSSRFPGKPLASIAGKSMLQRVYETALNVSLNTINTQVVIATDDDRIAEHCYSINAPFVMTSPDLPTGTDRVLVASNTLNEDFDFIINFQGDSPLTPPEFLQMMLDHFRQDPLNTEVITPVIRLDWTELDQMRNDKIKTPFSGTCAIVNPSNKDALWFSKNIIPAIRNELNLRESEKFSPVYRHIGIYGFRKDILEKYTKLPLGAFEQLEGLEQLRMLENGIKIKTVQVSLNGKPSISGIDSPEDLIRAEQLIQKYH
jgi:3-deoxy-manno-octulosonate cytidylyltransferase (CMP-KDO synthetase)